MWGSGLAGVLCAVAAMLTRHHNLWRVGLFSAVMTIHSTCIALISAFGCWKSAHPILRMLQVGFVASFVSKFSDTVSSEIGKVSRDLQNIAWF